MRTSHSIKDAFDLVFSQDRPVNTPKCPFSKGDEVKVLSIEKMGLRRISGIHGLINKTFVVEDYVGGFGEYQIKLSSGYWHSAAELEKVN